MEYDKIIYLVSKTQTKDEIGNYIDSAESLTKTYAKAQSVRTNEFYSAVEVGITPSIEFVIKRLNYSGEEEIEYDNTRYIVIRSQEPQNKFDIVLVCAKKIGVNGVTPSA